MKMPAGGGGKARGIAAWVLKRGAQWKRVYLLWPPFPVSSLAAHRH